MAETDPLERLMRARLTLDGTDQPLEMDRQELERCYWPLANVVLERQPENRREIAAVAGPPGSGKSAFAMTLVAVINALAGSERAVLVGLDGWHYPNAYLDSYFVESDGQRLPLRQIKGSPATFDVEGLLEFLKRVKEKEQVIFPVYSRAIHEAVPGGGVVEQAQRIVVLEGNYLLLDIDPWKGLRGLLDLTIFLNARPETLFAGLRERHRRGGKSPEEIERQMREVDIPDIELVLQHSTPADIVVHKADHRSITGVEWNIRNSGRS